MVESAVTEFLSICPAAELYLVDRAHERSSVWELPRVHRTINVDLAGDQLKALDTLNRIPLLWRLSSCYQSQLVKRLFSKLGGRSRASDLPVSSRSGGASPATLGEFCKDFDVLYIAGGGNITDTFPLELLRKCAWISCFSEQGKPVVLTGQQLGPFQSESTSNAATRALGMCNFVGVREPLASFSFCENAGLPASKFALMGDDSFGLPKPEATEVDRLLSTYGVERGRFIALNLRATSYMPETNRRLASIAELVKKLIQELKLPVLVVPIVLAGTESDILAGKQLAALVGGSSVRVMESDGLNPTTARGVLGCALGGLGTSYHFCTFSLSESVPVICLHEGSYYNQKAEGIAAFWGEPRFAMALSDMKLEAAMSQVREVFFDFQVREKLAHRAREADRVWHETFRIALSSAGIVSDTSKSPHVSIVD